MSRSLSSFFRKAPAVFCIICAILFLSGAADPSEAVAEALNTCAAVLIPSLFPYMVLSSLLVRWGASDLLGRPLEKVFRRIYRMPGRAAGAVLLGMLCGFPIGADCACTLYERGELSKDETERLIALANNTGPAFVIGVVGAFYWQDRAIGLVIYAAQIVSALLIGMLYARRSKNVSRTPAELCSVPVENSSVLSSLAGAVVSSAASMLNVCGFVVFFAGVLSVIRSVLLFAGAERVLPLLSVLLEFCAGSADAASLGGISGAFLAGMAVGWSGISVFAQCSSFTLTHGLSLRPAFISKFFQGLLCGGITAIWYVFFGSDASVICSALPLSDLPRYAVWGEIALLVFFCLFPLPRNLTQNKNTNRKT